jgi:hypothetical protein
MAEPHAPASLWVLFFMFMFSLAVAVNGGALGVILWLILWVTLVGVISVIAKIVWSARNARISATAAERKRDLTVLASIAVVLCSILGVLFLVLPH